MLTAAEKRKTAEEKVDTGPHEKAASPALLGTGKPTAVHTTPRWGKASNGVTVTWTEETMGTTRGWRPPTTRRPAVCVGHEKLSFKTEPKKN